MKIRNVKICLSEDIDSPIKATADIYIKDGFRLYDVRIVANLNHGIENFVIMKIINFTGKEGDLWTKKRKKWSVLCQGF